MATTSYYQMTDSDMESTADIVKSAVLGALSRDGTLTEVEAEEWSEGHTLVMRKKNIFRTISDKFKKQDDSENGQYWIVVRKV